MKKLISFVVNLSETLARSWISIGFGSDFSQLGSLVPDY